MSSHELENTGQEQSQTPDMEAIRRTIRESNERETALKAKIVQLENQPKADSTASRWYENQSNSLTDADKLKHTTISLLVRHAETHPDEVLEVIDRLQKQHQLEFQESRRWMQWRISTGIGVGLYAAAVWVILHEDLQGGVSLIGAGTAIILGKSQRKNEAKKDAAEE